MTTTFPRSAWLKATFIGWLVGIVLILVLSSALDAAGIEGMQFYLGIGMGAAVGFMQWRVLKKTTPIDANWIWYSILGLGVPFLVFDLYSKFGGAALGSWYLPLSIGVGGIVLGALQAILLGKYYKNAGWWALWCCLSWWLAMAVVLGIDYTKYVSNNNWVLFFLNIGLMLGGGVVLGWVSGHFLNRIKKNGILLLALCISVGLANAQNGSGVPLDANGVSVESSVLQDGLPYLPGHLFSAFSYDTVRFLAEVNIADEADAYPWISPDGLHLYYTSGANDNQLMFTKRADTNSFFETPVLVPISTLDFSPASFWLSEDELDVYCCNGWLYYAHRNSVGSSFDTLQLITLNQPYPDVFFRGASFDKAQNTLFVSAFSPGEPTRIFEFTRTGPNAFDYVKSLTLPAGFTPQIGQISKDELTFFVSAGALDGSNQLLYQMTRSISTDTFSVTTFEEVHGINDPLQFNGQPSMSENLSWVAFVRAAENLWRENNLYLAHKSGGVMPVFDSGAATNTVGVYPNPSSGMLYVTGAGTKSLNLDIFNQAGIRILYDPAFHPVNAAKIDLSGLPPGVYFLRLFDDTRVLAVKKVLLTD